MVVCVRGVLRHDHLRGGGGVGALRPAGRQYCSSTKWSKRKRRAEEGAGSFLIGLLYAAIKFFKFDVSLLQMNEIRTPCFFVYDVFTM